MFSLYMSLLEWLRSFNLSAAELLYELFGELWKELYVPVQLYPIKLFSHVHCVDIITVALTHTKPQTVCVT